MFNRILKHKRLSKLKFKNGRPVLTIDDNQQIWFEYFTQKI